MEIKFNNQHEETFKEIAEQYGTSADKLKELYCEIMYSNFFDDVCDIANENEMEEWLTSSEIYPVYASNEE